LTGLPQCQSERATRLLPARLLPAALLPPVLLLAQLLPPPVWQKLSLLPMTTSRRNCPRRSEVPPQQCSPWAACLSLAAVGPCLQWAQQRSQVQPPLELRQQRLSSRPSGGKSQTLRTGLQQEPERVRWTMLPLKARRKEPEPKRKLSRPQRRPMWHVWRLQQLLPLPTFHGQNHQHPRHLAMWVLTTASESLAPQALADPVPQLAVWKHVLVHPPLCCLPRRMMVHHRKLVLV